MVKFHFFSGGEIGVPRSLETRSPVAAPGRGPQTKNTTNVVKKTLSKMVVIFKALEI